jgi:NAD(P)-dependent dehydrogenase (short-subunit alcohol dehydrogenase family)
MKRILITGSNRGIGLARTRRYLTAVFVFATVSVASRGDTFNVL